MFHFAISVALSWELSSILLLLLIIVVLLLFLLALSLGWRLAGVLQPLVLRPGTGTGATSSWLLVAFSWTELA